MCHHDIIHDIMMHPPGFLTWTAKGQQDPLLRESPAGATRANSPGQDHLLASGLGKPRGSMGSCRRGWGNFAQATVVGTQAPPGSVTWEAMGEDTHTSIPSLVGEATDEHTPVPTRTQVAPMGGAISGPRSNMPLLS